MSMNTYLDLTVTCPCCRKPYRAKMLKSLFRGPDASLDGDTGNPGLCDAVTQCPHCGLATGRVTEIAPQAVRDCVASPAYRSVLSLKIDERARRMMLASLADEAWGSAEDAGDHALMAAWQLRDAALPYRTALQRAIECYLRHLESHQDIGIAITVIDLMRQTEQFSTAAEAAEELFPFLQDDWQRDVLAFEQRCIRARDAGVHRRSEVRG